MTANAQNPPNDVTSKGSSRPVGRPPSPMPARIEASPESIASFVVKAKPKKDWRYMKARS